MSATYAPDSDLVRVLLHNTGGEEVNENRGCGVDGDCDGVVGDVGGGKEIEEEEEKKEEGEGRVKWSSQMEYMLSTVGYCVGVGNVFRFPYVCNKNGGGAFLLPFLVCLVLIGMPMFFLESSLGQFRGKSPLHVWSICPLLKGIGMSSGLLAALVYWYYNIILAWSLYYLVSSFQSTLPWMRCDQWWNTPNCRTFTGPRNATSLIATSVDNVTSLGTAAITSRYDEAASQNGGVAGEEVSDTQSSSNITPHLKIVTATEEFWQHNVLQKSSGLFDTGGVVWYLALSQIVVIVFIFLALFKGIKTSGKVVYVTATLPYVVLTVLLIRSVTLPGAGEGILYYITPDFQKLMDYNIWVQAVVQVFYSLALAWGVLQTLASFNTFHTNVLRDSMIITLVGEGTSVYAGFVVFSVLGYLANQSSVPVDQVVSSGPGLAFVVYPEALSLMPLSQLWSILFFIMLVAVVIDTQLATGETLFTILSDQFPRTLLRHGSLIRAGVSVLVLLLSLPFVTQGGVYAFQLVDWYIGSYTMTIIALLECIVIAWVYGLDRFGDDVEMMIGRKPPVIMNFLWRYILPVFFVALFVITLAKYEPPTYGDYHYDTMASMIGWIIASISFLPIPVVAVIRLSRAKGSLLQRLKQTTRPDEDWGPSDPQYCNAYRSKHKITTPTLV
ncbi:hypothetical protein ACOMHN_016098 [Nucella lapillus]